MKKLALAMLVLFSVPAFAPPTLLIDLDGFGALPTISSNNRFCALIRQITNHVRIYNLDTGEMEHEFPVDKNANSMIFSPDGKEVLIGYDNGNVIGYAVASGDKTATFLAHDSPVIALEMVVDTDRRRTLLAALSESGEGKIWDYSADRKPLKFTFKADKGQHMSLSLEGSHFAIVTDRAIHLWNLTTGVEIQFGGNPNFFLVPEKWNLGNISFTNASEILLSVKDKKVVHSREVWRIKVATGKLVVPGMDLPIASRDIPNIAWMEFSYDGMFGFAPSRPLQNNGGSYICAHYYALAALPTYKPIRTNQTILKSWTALSQDGKRGVVVNETAVPSVPTRGRVRNFRLEVFDF